MKNEVTQKTGEKGVKLSSTSGLCRYFFIFPKLIAYFSWTGGHVYMWGEIQLSEKPGYEL